MKDDGNVNGPTCKNVCKQALGQNCEFNACDEGRQVAYPDIESFAPVAEGLGFDCKEGGCWWPEAPGEGLYLVSINTDGDHALQGPLWPDHVGGMPDVLLGQGAGLELPHLELALL